MRKFLRGQPLILYYLGFNKNFKIPEHGYKYWLAIETPPEVSKGMLHYHLSTATIFYGIDEKVHK